LGEPTALFYSMAENIQPFIDSLGDVFYKLEWVDAGPSEGVDTLTGTFLDSVTSRDCIPPYIEVAFFKDTTDNEDYFFIVNRRCLASESQAVDIEFGSQYATGTYDVIDQYSEESHLIGNVPCCVDLNIVTTLTPGQGKLFKVGPTGTWGNVFIDTVEAISPETVDLVWSSYVNGGKYFFLENDQEYGQTARTWLNHANLYPAADMYYIENECSEGKSITGPLPGTDSIPFTYTVPAASCELFKVVPVYSSDGLPDDSLPLKWDGCVKVAGKEVGEGETLDIYGPAVIEMDADSRIEVKRNGTLNATGSNGNLVKFVSAESPPAAGDWDWIEVEGRGTAAFDYCEFKHGYKGVWAKADRSDADSTVDVLIDHSTFDDIDVCGVEFDTHYDSPLVLVRNSSGIF